MPICFIKFKGAKMQIDVSKNQNFSLDYTTKSGKKLSLDMYDNQSINYNEERQF